jgi:hypothetical protein
MRRKRKKTNWAPPRPDREETDGKAPALARFDRAELFQEALVVEYDCPLIAGFADRRQLHHDLIEEMRRCRHAIRSGRERDNDAALRLDLRRRCAPTRGDTHGYDRPERNITPDHSRTVRNSATETRPVVESNK